MQCFNEDLEIVDFIYLFFDLHLEIVLGIESRQIAVISQLGKARNMWRSVLLSHMGM